MLPVSSVAGEGCGLDNSAACEDDEEDSSIALAAPQGVHKLLQQAPATLLHILELAGCPLDVLLRISRSVRTAALQHCARPLTLTVNAASAAALDTAVASLNGIHSRAGPLAVSFELPMEADQHFLTAGGGASGSSGESLHLTDTISAGEGGEQWGLAIDPDIGSAVHNTRRLGKALQRLCSPALQRLYVMCPNRLRSKHIAALQQLTGVTRLELHAVNSIQAIDWSFMPQLTALALVDWEHLVSIDVSGLRGLTHLEVTDCCQLPLLRLKHNTALRELRCASCGLRSLDVGGLSELEFLDCEFNKLTHLGIAGAAKLRRVTCGHNRLRELPLLLPDSGADSKDTPASAKQDFAQGMRAACGVPSLESLRCNRNRLTQLDLSGASGALRYVDCSWNRIATLTHLGAAPNLEQLDCSQNELTSIDLSGNPHVTELRCDGNGPMGKVEVLRAYGVTHSA